MPQNFSFPSDFCTQLGNVWSGIWGLTLGKPRLITRQDLKREGYFRIPEDVVFDCLRTFSEQGLIRCFNDADAVIENPSKESDFERFKFTAKAVKVGSNYDCNKNYDL